MKTVKTVCAALLLCLVVVLTKSQLTPQLMRSANYGLPALVERGGAGMLFIGSSMFRQGVDVDVLGTTERDWYLLTYNGLQPVTEELLLNRLADAGVEVGTLYVDMYAYSLCANPAMGDEKMTLELDLEGKAALWDVISRSSSADAASFWRLFVTGNNELLLTWPLYFPLVNRRFCRGGRSLPQEGLTAEQMAALEPPPIAGVPQQNQREAVQALIENARKHGTSVVFLETPKYQTVMENEDYIRAMEAYCALLEEEGVAYVLADDLCPEISLMTENFSDTIHLSSQGRVTYTKALAERLGW